MNFAISMDIKEVEVLSAFQTDQYAVRGRRHQLDGRRRELLVISRVTVLDTDGGNLGLSVLEEDKLVAILLKSARKLSMRVN